MDETRGSLDESPREQGEDHGTPGTGHATLVLKCSMSPSRVAWERVKLFVTLTKVN